MSDFKVEVVKIDNVEKHPDADRLTIVTIGGYKCIANLKDDGTWRYNTGDLVVYIPEQAIIPEWLLKAHGFWKEPEDMNVSGAIQGKGTLAGSKGNRVKAIKLRGIVSQGILYAGLQTMAIGFAENSNCKTLDIQNGEGREAICFEGQDVTELLGITKYEPEVPAHMNGEVAARSEYAFKYDIENMQKYNRIFEDGEEVVVTEKRHGTLCCLAYVPGMNNPDFLDGDFFASSKGMLQKGLFMKNNEANKSNMYHRYLISRNPVDETPMPVVLQKISQHVNGRPVYMFGEIFGEGVQDLGYFCKPRLEVFDIWVGMPSEGRYLSDGELEYVLSNVANMKRVPVLYRGPFNKEKMVELRDGKSTRDGKMIEQIKEGVVIRSTIEKENRWTGRTQLKFISPNYLLRKGETTEFQ